MDIPVSRRDDRIRVALRVSPGASRDQIVGIAASGAGQGRVLVSVCAPPDKGKANMAVIKLLAKAWRVPKSAMRIVAGATDRNKIIEVDAGGDPDTLLNRLREWGDSL